MPEYSYWETTSFLKPCDLVIVGAGIVGLSSALFYKRAHPGKRVLILEKGALPRGASTRNAGFACIGSITEHLADLSDDNEEELKNRIKRRYEGLNLLIDTLGEKEIEYENCGGFELFTDKETYREAEQQVDRFNGWLEELAGEKKVYRPWKMNGYNGIHNRLEGALHPGRMMVRLVDLVLREGVEIRWNSKVESIEAGNVLTGGGIRWETDNILIACNGFTRQLLPSLPIDPARGYIFVTNEFEELAWKGTFHHDRGYIYFRNIGNRLLLGGARNIDRENEKTDQLGINDVIKNHLVAFAEEKLKLEPGWHIDREWSGIMGFTEDKNPVLKQLDGNITVAAGLSGMGIAIGMQVARETVELLEK